MSYPPPVDPYETAQPTAPLYHQPVYGPPPSGYGQPAFPSAPSPPPPPRNSSRVVVITLLAAAIAAILVIGGGVTFSLMGDRLSGSPTPTPSPSPSPSVTAAPEDGISISEPDTLNGYAKIEAEELSSLTSDLEKELEGYPGAANAFGAVYGDVADKKLVAALAAEVDIDDPQQMLDVVFQSFSGKNQLTGVSPASTGTLGGVAQCGSTLIGSEDVAICGWADEGSVGMFLFFYQTAVDVKGDFPTMRAEIETRD